MPTEKKPLKGGKGNQGRTARGGHWGERLRQARLMRGLQTQDALAQLLNVNRRIISRWESGQLPQTSSLIELASALHLSIDWLLLSRGKMEQPDLAGS